MLLSIFMVDEPVKTITDHGRPWSEDELDHHWPWIDHDQPTMVDHGQPWSVSSGIDHHDHGHLMTQNYSPWQKKGNPLQKSKVLIRRLSSPFFQADI